MGRSFQTVKGIFNGDKAITLETAHELAAAFGTSHQHWLNLESEYRLSISRKANNDIARRAMLYSLAPVSDLIRRKWIKGSGNVSVLEKQIKEFYNVSDLIKIKRILKPARKSTSYAELNPAEGAWMARAKQLGRAVEAVDFDRKRFDDKFAELRTLAASEADVLRVPSFLSKMGVRLIIIEELPRTKIDGGAVWIDECKPVVALSFRIDRIDHFWFTLAHEMNHIRNGENAIDSNLVGPGRQATAEKPELEQRADLEAANFLVPSADLDKFIISVQPLFYKRFVTQFADQMQVHPGIIVGQLQFRDAIKYHHSREMLVKVRSIVTSAALTDGWGFVPTL